MNLQNLNSALTSTLDVAAGLAVPTVIGYTGGMIYGALTNADKTIAAKSVRHHDIGLLRFSSNCRLPHRG